MHESTLDLFCGDTNLTEDSEEQWQQSLPVRLNKRQHILKLLLITICRSLCKQLVAPVDGRQGVTVAWHSTLDGVL